MPIPFLFLGSTWELNKSLAVQSQRQVLLNRVGSGEFQGGHPEGAKDPSSQNCICGGLAEGRENREIPQNAGHFETRDSGGGRPQVLRVDGQEGARQYNTTLSG